MSACMLYLLPNSKSAEQQYLSFPTQVLHYEGNSAQVSNILDCVRFTSTHPQFLTGHTLLHAGVLLPTSLCRVYSSHVSITSD